MFSVIIRNDSSKDEWELLCSTSDEWEELTESFRGSKQSYERSLYKVLNEELLPDVLQMITAKVSTVIVYRAGLCILTSMCRIAPIQHLYF